MALPNDLRQLKSHGTATAAELAAFVRQMKGRRPQEVLGLVAQSGLSRGIFVATILTIGLMAVGTFGPYLYAKWWPSTPTARAPQNLPGDTGNASSTPTPSPETGNQASGQNGNTAPTGSSATSTPAATGNQPPKTAAEELLTSPPSDRNKKDALQRLGMDETKLADPKKNPLEDKTDDLLKDLK